MVLLDNRVKFNKAKKLSTLLLKYWLIFAVCLLLGMYYILQNNVYWQKLSLEISGSAYQATSNAGDKIKEISQNWTDYFANLQSLRQHNAELKEQIQNLEQKIVSDSLLERENSELKQIVNFTSQFKRKFITSTFLGQVSNASGNYGVVACGANAGVAKDDVVMSGQGVVGRVLSVSENYATVLLINDSKFRIPVATLSGQRGMYIGDASEPYIAYIKEPEKLEDGEMVFTVGDDFALLPNVPVARISAKADSSSHDKRDRVMVAPATNLEQLRVVIIGRII